VTVARGRMISRTLGSSRRFKALEDEAGELACFAQLLYVLCVSHADDFGRLEADAFTCKHRIFPVSSHDEVDFAHALRAIDKAGLGVWYRVDGQHILEITQFSVHQSGLHKRTASKFAAPPGAKDDAVETLDVPKAREKKRTGIERRAANLVEHYTSQYKVIRKQPYFQTDGQQKKDFDAAKTLCLAYEDTDAERIIAAFLQLDDSHPKAKMFAGKNRTIPMLLTVAAPIAEQLEIQGVVA
jgi:hypothetical protein